MESTSPAIGVLHAWVLSLSTLQARSSAGMWLEAEHNVLVHARAVSDMRPGEVAVLRRDEGCMVWEQWIREDVASHACRWCGFGIIPPSKFLVVTRP